MKSEEFTFTNEDAQLRGILALPHVSQPCPVVVVAHGTQAGSRDYFLYRHLAQLLSGCGIGTLRFDRRGEGASTGDPDAPFEQLARDVTAALVVLADHSSVDSARLALWGLSQGGWISVLGAIAGPPVAALVIVSGTPVTPAQQMTHAVTEILRRRGNSESVIARALSVRAAVEGYAKGELAIEVVKQPVEEARGEPWFEDAWIPDLESVDWRDMDLDITPLIRELRVPTLLVFGEHDPWIPIQETVATWEASLPSPEPAIQIIAGVGHEMVAGDPLAMAMKGEPAYAYEQTIVSWMRHVLRPQVGE
jgi:pimeloyl-ACP methyl ester carboxylesterase